MNFQFFESLTKKEANDYLEEFLLFGQEQGLDLLEENLHFTVDLDFDMESLPSVLKMLVGIVKTVPRDPDDLLPLWIRKTSTYTKGLFDFDEQSKSIVMAAAYYLGETFVKNFNKLSWATGNTDYAEGNMPVVTTFKYDIEMAPILISENMFSGIISGIRSTDSIDSVIAAWKADVPH